MYVCLCRAVTDHEIRDAIESGASSLDEISCATRAGSVCGGCVPDLARLLEACTGRELASQS